MDTNGFIQERFFGLIHVFDTAALTLKDAIYSSLAHYNLDVQNIRGQGYDGASNMRGEFNGLQALIIKDCRSAYYVHCFAHRLQLALIAGSKNRNDELKNTHTDDIAHLIAINELEKGRGLNQIDATSVYDEIVGAIPMVDLFYASIDSQLQEINGRFSDDAMELLILSTTLNPQNAVESFRVEDICKLVEKFYAQDFTRDKKEQSEIQLKHYEYNIVKGPNYNNLATILELCQCFHCYYRTIIFCDEYCENKASEQNGG
ncbi:uncharacterized protein LOC121979484 [Zingiber officinale]|uniref:uncharacterized protein LOC121979484 n=1 Tax=Zingiber officinale TaxID=94328 RepID=UPI001C4DC1E6|nr:uncharacterized protein LOC121979484 [Zingiber officinale]